MCVLFGALRRVWGLAHPRAALPPERRQPPAGSQPTPHASLRWKEENIARGRVKAVTWDRGGKNASWNDHWLCIVFSLSLRPDIASRFLSSRGSFGLVMISKVKNAMSTLVGGMMPHGHNHHHHHNHHSGGGQTCGAESLPPRFPYGRPDFLDLTPELLQYSTEHASRPVLALKRGSRLPWGTGYAEWVAQWMRSPEWSTDPFCCYDCVIPGMGVGPGLQQPQQLWEHCSSQRMANRAFCCCTLLPQCFLHELLWMMPQAPCHYTDMHTLILQSKLVVQWLLLNSIEIVIVQS